MKKFILLVSLIASAALAETISLPNLNKNVTGTNGATGHYAMDVAIVGGITIGAVNQGTPNASKANAWWVTGTDGTNSQLYTAAGAAKTDLEQYLGAAFSATNAPSCRITNGAAFVDPTQIRALTSSDVVSAAQSGTWNITNVSGTVSLPTGASTSALQTTANTSLSSIDTKTPALGQALAAASTPVVLTAAQITTLTPLSTVTANIGTTNGLALDTSVNGILLSQGSTTSGQKGVLHLGAVTTAAPTYTTAQSSPLSLNTAGGLRVDPSGVTSPVSLASLPALVAGAALIGKVGIDQTTVGTTNAVSLAQIGANTVLTGNGVSGTGSQRVNIASDNTAFPTKVSDGTNTATVKAASTAAVAADTALVVAISPNNSIAATTKGTSAADKARNDYTSTSVTTGAYVQLIASTAAAANSVEIFDSSGQTLFLATGAAASEVNQVYIFPGGNGRIPLSIPAGTRISIKAVSATASAGEIDINLYQ